MNTIHNERVNERVRLFAAALNNTAIAAVVAGVVAPLASVLYSVPAAPASKLWWLIALAWLAGAFLHVAGQIVLGGLRP